MMPIKKQKICIIDDNKAICHSLEILFKCIYGEEFTIESYSSPVSFLQEFSSEWQGCLIIDLFMPYWNGIDLMKELKRLKCNMSFIIMSGHGNKTVAAQSLKAGAYAFMSKPLNVEKLLEKLNGILQEAHT